MEILLPLLLGAVGLSIVLLLASVMVRSIADFMKRVLLALSALDFKRIYSMGGIGLLILVAEEGFDGSGRLLGLDEWVLLSVVLAAPLAATFISEVTFLLILVLTANQAVPNSLGRIEIRTTEGNRVRMGLLSPVTVPAGGFKQLVRCFVAQSFTSHFFGYAPYSALAGDGAYRVTILAKSGDASDLEKIPATNFRVKRITARCWILVREEVDPGSDLT